MNAVLASVVVGGIHKGSTLRVTQYRVKLNVQSMHEEAPRRRTVRRHAQVEMLLLHVLSHVLLVSCACAY